jgi:hypothetical protein
VIFRKILLDDLDVMSKHRRMVQTRNYYVSVMVEEFTCGSVTAFIEASMTDALDRKFGISKSEYRVSSRRFVNGLLGNINGGS